MGHLDEEPKIEIADSTLVARTFLFLLFLSFLRFPFYSFPSRFLFLLLSSFPPSPFPLLFLLLSPFCRQTENLPTETKLLGGVTPPTHPARYGPDFNITSHPILSWSAPIHPCHLPFPSKYQPVDSIIEMFSVHRL